jgi:hypothetical protein
LPSAGKQWKIGKELAVFSKLAVFVRRKTMDFRKTPSEFEIMELLRQGEVRLPPFSISIEEMATSAEDGFDAWLRLDWGRRRFRFVTECKRLWTPKAVSEAASQIRRFARPPEFYPMLVVPYLPDARLADLQAQGVSGIDLCGNGVVAVPDELLVYRTGRPNRFRSEAEIKNVFRGESSLVARAFLTAPKYASVQDARKEIERLGGSVALSTVSKVCKSLESMLVVERQRGKGSVARKLRLLQAEKLLDLLAENYTAPAVTRSIRGKTRLSPEALGDTVSRAKKPAVRVVQTGLGSVGSYAVMAKEPVQYYYCTDLEATLAALSDDFEPTERFSNVELSETRDDTVYFDARPGLVASPIQVYLELMSGDKRTRETAEQVRRVILAPLGGPGKGG